MTVSKVMLDSSAWLRYFLSNEQKVKELLDSNETLLFTSVISFHEVHKALSKYGRSSQDLHRAIAFIEDSSIVLPVSKDIALSSSMNCLRHKLHTVDSIIYTTAEGVGSELVTFDRDFKGLAKVRLLSS